MLVASVTLLACATLASAAWAEEPARGDAAGEVRGWPRPSLAGSLRAGAWASDRRLRDDGGAAPGALWLEGASRLGERGRAYVQGWVANEAYAGVGNLGCVREAYAEASVGPLDLRAGRQILAWGRADRLNPTDTLTPRNHTMLSHDDEDQRVGAYAVSAVAHAFGHALAVVWLPVFEPDVVALPPEVPSLPERVPTDAGGFALKLDREGGAVDWSVSLHRGLDLTADTAIAVDAGGEPRPFLTHRRVVVLGADAATTAGAYGLRAEAAYVVTEDRAGTDPLTANPYLHAVAGADRDFAGGPYVNLQGFVRLVRRFQGAAAAPEPLQPLARLDAALHDQYRAWTYGYALRVSKRWLGDTLETEIVVVQAFPRAGLAVRPKAAYALDDRWKILVGADVFRGPAESRLGRLRENGGAFATMTYAF